MGRHLSDWLSGYLEFAKDTEPPTSYHVWTGISIISSALQRKCYFRRGHETIYPNSFIVLIGPSGQSRKGVAINLGKPFLEHIGVQVIPQSIIREALIRRLKDNITQFIDDEGAVRFQCAGIITSEELQVFLGVKDTRFLADLTDWYDSSDRWTYETKHQGTDSLSGLCISLLGATAPDWLPSILPIEAVGGGFTSRIIFVVEDYKGKTVPDPKPADEELQKKLQDDLQDIHLLTGHIQWSKEAHQLYRDWYVRQDKNIRKGRSPIPDPKFSGYVSRRPTHLVKLCMALSVSRGNDLIITEEDFGRGRKIIEATEKKMARAFSGLGRARFADLTDGVLRYIMARRSVKRSEILSKFYRDVDSWTMEQIERVLYQMKVIEVIHLLEEEDVVYKFIGAAEDSSTLSEAAETSEHIETSPSTQKDSG